MALEWGREPEVGWTVVAVAPDGPAAAAGVEEQDWLLSVDGVRVVEEDDHEAIEERVERHETLLLSLRRGDRMKLVAVTPTEPTEETPDDPTTALPEGAAETGSATP
jgi:predicted metalloprotease with PDZ domain